MDSARIKSLKRNHSIEPTLERERFLEACHCAGRIVFLVLRKKHIEWAGEKVRARSQP